MDLRFNAFLATKLVRFGASKNNHVERLFAEHDFGCVYHAAAD
jgi:hypothetical protein